MATGEFRYVTTNLRADIIDTANPIISELPFTNVNYTNQLNSNGTFQGHVLLSGINSDVENAYDGTIPGKTILWVLYTDTFSDPEVVVPVWSGVIWAREYDSESQTLSITAQEMMSLYEKRLLTTDFSYTNSFYDPAFIARQLMAFAESTYEKNTNLEILPATTTYATKQYYYGYERKSVYQAIKDLASRFFDFKVRADIQSGYLVNQFVLGQNIGQVWDATSPIAIVFAYPGNLVSYTFPEDASGAANTLYGFGYGANGTKLIATAVDEDKLNEILGGDWPLLEATASYTDIPDLQLLKDLTLGQLDAISYPPTTVQVVIAPYTDPVYPSYNVGDQVMLSIQDSYFPNYLNQVFRIMAISVNPGEAGPSRITVTLTRLLAAGQIE
jgi:hypothetical protein